LNNNDIFKKLRVALSLRDEQIVEILELVDFRISKAELGAFFRKQDHPNYMECGDQVLRNFLNGLVIHLRGTKDAPKDPQAVLATHQQQEKSAQRTTPAASAKTPSKKPKTQGARKQAGSAAKKPIRVVENVKFKNGKKK
jgi:hypothetical protein